MFKKKCIIAIALVICFLVLSGAKTIAEEYDWNKVNKTFIEYIESGGYEKGEELLKLLPDHSLSTEERRKGLEAIEDYFSGKYSNDVLIGSGDLVNINIIFRLRHLTDAAYAQHLSILLGSLIEKYSQNFLLALEQNLERILMRYILNSILCNTGPEFVDKPELHIDELKKRYKALEEVEGANELVKELCLTKIELAICREEKYINN